MAHVWAPSPQLESRVRQLLGVRSPGPQRSPNISEDPIWLTAPILWGWVLMG